MVGNVATAYRRLRQCVWNWPFSRSFATLLFLHICVVSAMGVRMKTVPGRDSRSPLLGRRAPDVLEDNKGKEVIDEGSSSSSRKLLQPGVCSDVDYSHYAVMFCANAVREHPWKFGGDYPCNFKEFRWDIFVGAPPLTLNHSLITAAQDHADYLASVNFPSHRGSDGSTAGMRALRNGYSYDLIGENVGTGFYSAKELVMAWMCSPLHRNVLMDCRYGEVGYGVATAADGTTYFTQSAGCPLNDVPCDATCRS